MARLVKLEATGPVKVDPSDKPVFVCACGLSKMQPFCDGSHTSSKAGIKPVVWTQDADKTAWLCGCKRTGNLPFCDGTHKKL